MGQEERRAATVLAAWEDMEERIVALFDEAITLGHPLGEYRDTIAQHIAHLRVLREMTQQEKK